MLLGTVGAAGLPGTLACQNHRVCQASRGHWVLPAGLCPPPAQGRVGLSPRRALLSGSLPDLLWLVKHEACKAFSQ